MNRIQESSGHDTSLRWLLAFILTEIAGELLLAFLNAEAGLRIAIRSSAFGIGLVYLVLLRRQGPGSSVRGWYIAVILALSLGALHPDSAGLLARVAQFALYLAVLSPLLWMSGLDTQVRDLRYVLGVVWGFHTLSALVGVLQVFFPGKFDTALSTAIASQGDAYVRSLLITLDSGEQVFRPMGLTDFPGGAAYSGLYAAVLGTGFLLFGRGLGARPLFIGSIAIGCASIALSQTRSAAVDAGICFAALLLILVVRRRTAQVVLVSALLAIAGVGGIALALSKAGDQVISRYSTLLADSPEEVYRSNRGLALERTLGEELAEFPLGAGSARWGMMPVYFGDDSDPAPLYAEIQISGWVYDGGVPLMLAYLGLIAVVLFRVFRMATRSIDRDLQDWATVVLAYDVGAVALIFSYPLFVSQSGLEFWLFNALVLSLERGSGMVRAPASLRPILALESVAN